MIELTEANQVLLRSAIENVAVAPTVHENGTREFTFNVLMSKYNSAGPMQLENELNSIYLEFFTDGLFVSNSIDIFCKFYFTSSIIF